MSSRRSGSSRTTTGPPRPWLLPGEWRRASRGREVQFFCTDADIVELMRTALPASLAPYVLHGRVEGWEPWEWEDVSIPPERMLEVASFALPNRHTVMNIRSCRVHSDPPRSGNLGALFAVNGLIQVDHGGLSPRGKRESSRFAVVDRVRNSGTEEVVTHEECASVFASLKRAVSRLAIVPTRTWDGHPGWPMSKQAADEAARGMEYIHAPM